MASGKASGKASGRASGRKPGQGVKEDTGAASCEAPGAVSGQTGSASGKATGRDASIFGACSVGHPTSESRRLLPRLVHKHDFERVLTTPARWRSAHFAIHHLDAVPTAFVWSHRPPSTEKLSTDPVPLPAETVDDSASRAPARRWLGMVVPKRHARRSVTRTLLKRQIRAVMACHARALSPGLWLVRLRAPYPVAQFSSAASEALRSAAQRELEQLIAGVAR